MNNRKRKIIASRMKLVERILSEILPPNRGLYSKEERRDIQDAYASVDLSHPVRARNLILNASRRSRMAMQLELFWSVYRDAKEGIASGHHFDVKFNVATISSGRHVLLAGSLDDVSPSMWRNRREYSTFLQKREEERQARMIDPIHDGW